MSKCTLFAVHCIRIVTFERLWTPKMWANFETSLEKHTSLLSRIINVTRLFFFVANCYFVIKLCKQGILFDSKNGENENDFEEGKISGKVFVIVSNPFDWDSNVEALLLFYEIRIGDPNLVTVRKLTCSVLESIATYWSSWDTFVSGPRKFSWLSSVEIKSEN